MSADGTVTVLAKTMAGNETPLAPLPSAALVADLAKEVREKLNVPITAQNLLYKGQLLTDLTMSLASVFGSEMADIEIMVVQRPLTDQERHELHIQLVRAAAAGNAGEVHELLKEGAAVELIKDGNADEEWTPEAAGTANEECSASEASDVFRESPVDQKKQPPKYCGLTPLMMAIAAGEENLAQELRKLGASEPDMTPQHSTLAEAFRQEDLVDVTRHLAAGADVETKLRQGEGITATNSGVPLHACCAMYPRPGALEVAQLLIRKKADLQAGDAEGDTPLAHVEYFSADDLFRLFEPHGAEVSGPDVRTRVIAFCPEMYIHVEKMERRN
eukprot:TRINITY_DN1776_c0_g1_i2.p1 TRINITY_DN1776_c0_g1~~TRINITY_DN1776_c0_g1_i2.p1  ORF type:complete len:348 (-),score=82.80 TRINITY_DN1776_c0_g1_i2:233-1225(-)